MLYVFKDGRVIYDAEYLTKDDDGKYIAVEELPSIPPVNGKLGYCVANLTSGLIEFRYKTYEPPEPGEAAEQLQPQEPPLSETEQTQLETALNIAYLICLAELKN